MPAEKYARADANAADALAFLPGPQVDCGHLYFLVAIDQQCGPPIQLVGDIEQMFGDAVRRQVRQQRSANPKVFSHALAFGDERIGRLLNTVVEESIGFLLAENQPGAGGIQKRVVDLLFRLSENHTQCRNLDHVTEIGELLKSGLRPVRQSLELPHHEVRHVVGVVLRVNPAQVPGPSPLVVMEREQALVRKHRNKLNCKKWIPSRLLMD